MKRNELVDKWNSDLSQGNKGERIIMGWLKTKGFRLSHYNNNNKYDIEIISPKNKLLKLECKTDRWEHFNYITNNMFIEVKCGDKLSGIWTSEADIYVYYYPDLGEIWVATKKDLCDFIKENGHLLPKSNRSGDNGKVVGFLYNRKTYNVFKKYQIKKIDLNDI